MKVYPCFDKPSKTWYAKWRDENGKLKSMRLAHRSDRLRSKKDVRESSEFKAIERQVGGGFTDPTQAKLLLAVARVRGKTKPDSSDKALVERVVSDDTGRNMLLADFVETIYLPFAEASLRGKTVREYRSLWTRYGMAEKVAGLRVSDFETHHGRGILEAIAAQDVSKTTVQHAKFFLSGVFVLAANKGLCKTNPMRE